LKIYPRELIAILLRRFAGHMWRRCPCPLSSLNGSPAGGVPYSGVGISVHQGPVSRDPKR